MTDLERAVQVFSGDTFSAQVGCVIEEVGQGYAKCSLRLAPWHYNKLGIPMGGAVFTLGDFAFGVAANFDRDVFVTSAMDVHFMTPAKGKILYAEAREIHSGRRTCLFSVTVTDDLGTNVSYMTGSGMKIQKRSGGQ